MAETYYFGQGKVFIKAPGAPDWHWMGDVGNLTLSATENKITHTESYSGNRQEVRSILFSSDTKLEATLFEIGTKNLIQVLRGKEVEIPGGTVTGEDLGTVQAGSILIPENAYGISNLVITDNGGMTFDAEHYSVAAPGVIEILSLPTTLPDFPLQAAYDYVGGSSVPMFTNSPEDVTLKYVGINLAENGRNVIVEFYRVATGALQSLALINDSDFGSMPWTASVLADSTKPSGGDLGQIGRFINVGV